MRTCVQNGYTESTSVDEDLAAEAPNIPPAYQLMAECAELLAAGGDGLRTNLNDAAMHYEAASELATKDLKTKLASRYREAARQIKVLQSLCNPECS